MMEDTLDVFHDTQVPQRYPCPICQRKFNEDVLPRHKSICEKSAKKNRKPFSSQKQRLIGSDAKLQRKKNQEPEKVSKKNNWRAKHEAFLATVRAARGSSSTSQATSKLVAPSTVVNPDYVQCPHCQRRFNEHSAQRHIEFCKEQKSRVVSKKADAQDLTRLAKRTQYKPPLPGKKRSVPNLDSPSANKNQRQVLSSKYSNSSYTPSSFDKDRKISSRVPTDSQYNGSSPNGGVPSKHTVARRTQSTKATPGQKEMVTRRHSSTTSSGNKDSADIESRSPKTQVANGLFSLSQADITGDLFHDEDISRAASGNRRNRNLQRPKATLLDDFDGQTSMLQSHKKLGSRLSDLGNMHDRSGSGEESDCCRPSGGVRRKGSGHSSPGSSVSSKESGVSVGSARDRSGTKLPKFCYECGTKYPVPQAKYCCECGVRRVCIDT